MSFGMMTSPASACESAKADHVAGSTATASALSSAAWCLGQRLPCHVPLALARKNAGELEARVRLGEDPALDKENAKIEADATLGALAAQYLEARKSEWRPDTYDEVRRHLMKYAKPLHRVPIASVSQRSIAGLLNNLEKSSGPITANRVRTSLTALFGWVLKQGTRLPEGNVASYTDRRKETPRKRVLDKTELKLIWDSCLDDDFGAAVRLLILTGQRASEIGSLCWDEIRGDRIELPETRTKNKRPHRIPLSDAAAAILESRRRDGRAFVFGRLDSGFKGWDPAKRRLDLRIAKTAGAPLKPWTIHDLRRTCATEMAESPPDGLGIQPHVVEGVLNHASGHKGGVAGIYNRATYDKGKREALNLWAEHVMATVEGRAATVVPLKRA